MMVASAFLYLLLIHVVAMANCSVLESCLSEGFDPSNLSCDACVFLKSTNYHLTCLECCQSYKTLDSRTSRYDQAILIHSPGSEEIDKFIEEELKGIQDNKIGFNVEKQRQRPGMFFSMSPNVLYFFKGEAPSSGGMKAYAESAQEEIVLHGWSKDDLKDMINTLLPDRKQ
mmetsp:Transcript_8984/g.13810  ORF Transcript_8984/g.13810 Transcript_8984/m.13810 type:complete len:171 (+) Transcript_8984:103-615(+)